MTKQKKSFFEKLTGIQRIDDEENEIEINDTSLPSKKNKEVDSEKNKEADEEKDFFEKEENASFKVEENSFKDKLDEVEDDFGEDDFSTVEADEDDDNMMAPPKPSETSTKKEINDDEVEEVDAEGQLTIDVYQTDKDIVIKSTIAGVKPEDLDVDINSEMVTIKGKRTQDEEIDAENYYYQECYWGPFSRSIILPVEIVTEKAEATMKNGILTIRLPKMEVAKTRKLQVRGF
jgi:HSP20 family protein